MASRLGTTKGSFYWHFVNRRALIYAALERWEQWGTTDVIAGIDGMDAPGDQDPEVSSDIAAPADRLRALLSLVVTYTRRDRIEIALLSAADDPSVRAALNRVTARRIEYVATLLREVGLEETTAARRASILVGIYLGHLQSAHTAPEYLPQTRESWQAQVNDIVTSFLPSPNPG